MICFILSTASGKVAYIASNSEGGKGGLDIYKITFWGSEKPQSLDAEEEQFSSSLHCKSCQGKTIAQPILVEERNLTVFQRENFGYDYKESRYCCKY